MKKEVIDILEKEFAKENIKTRVLGGTRLSYLEAQIVIRRLNKAFDQDWSFEIRDTQITDGHIYVLGRIMVQSDNGTFIIKESFGGKKVTMKADKSGMLDLGNDMKAAQSDSLKKCASLLGIGLDLYGEDEIEATDKDSKKASPAAEGAQSAHAETEEKISSAQIGAIKAISKAKGVKNLSEYLTTELKRAVTDDLSGLSKSEASLVITKLNVHKSE